ncbi:PD-(D/E)XK nuclease family protein [Olivibacter ginsenosidimutans]
MTLPFLKEVALDLVSRFGDDLKDLALIFNNKRPELYFKQYLAEILQKPIWSPSFFTIQDFFKAGSPLLEADKISQIVCLHECYVQLLTEQQQEPLNIDRFFPIAETILSDFAQLDYDLVDPGAIYQEIHDLAEIEKQFQFLTAEQVTFLESFWKSFHQYGQLQLREKFIQLWKIMPRLYVDFTRSLHEQGWTTLAGIYRSMATDLTTGSSLTASFKQLIFIGFNAINNAEGTLFNYWQEQGKALFYFDADAYYVEDNLQEAGYFIRKNRNRWQLKNALGPFPDHLKSKTNAINLVEASGFTAQAKVLHSLLPQVPTEKSIAILLADESLLIPTLQSIPEQLTSNITMGFPLSQSPLFGFIDLWLKTQTNYHETKSDTIAYQAIESYVSHPLVMLPLSEKEQLLQDIQEHHYVQVPNLALQKYTHVASFFKKQDEPLLLIRALEELLRRIFNHRKESKQLTLIEASLLTSTLQELNHLFDSIQQHRSLQQADIRFLITLIRRHLFQVNAAIEGDPLKGIQIMGLLESRNLDFEEIYLLGANDGMLPKRSFGNTYIPDAIRRAYGLPVLENQEALSAYLFYRLLQRTKKLHVVYNHLVDDNSTGEVTRFVKQLAFESNFSCSTLKQQQETKSAKQPLPLTIPKTGRVAETLAAYLDQGGLKISATALTNYIQSPLLFFFKHVARIQEPEVLAEDFQVNKIGSIVHQVMQWFYEELKVESAWITAERIKDKRPALPSLCLKALSIVVYHDKDYLKPEKTNSIEKIILQIVEDYAHIILKTDVAACPFELLELENNEDYVVDFPIQVNGEERWVKLQGIIDRIDQREGIVRIVDYKTGSDGLTYMRNTENLFDPKDPKYNKALIQTLFYTFIYEQKSGKQNVEPHLYTVRKLNNEGSFFQSDQQPLRGEKLNALKAVFIEQLRETLQELFNPDIPFQHRPDMILPYHDLYQEFFRAYGFPDTSLES